MVRISVSFGMIDSGGSRHHRVLRGTPHPPAVLIEQPDRELGLARARAGISREPLALVGPHLDRHPERRRRPIVVGDDHVHEPAEPLASSPELNPDRCPGADLERIGRLERRDRCVEADPHVLDLDPREDRCASAIEETPGANTKAVNRASEIQHEREPRRPPLTKSEEIESRNLNES